MALTSIEEIARAIEALTPQELDALYVWLEQHYPQPIDARIESDLEAGRLDKAIHVALEDERNGRTKPI